MSKKNDSGISWIMIGVCFSIYWPLGLILLIKKLRKSNWKQAKETLHDNDKMIYSGLIFLLAGLVLMFTRYGGDAFSSVRSLTGFFLSLYGCGLSAWTFLDRQRSKLFKKYASIIGSRRVVSIEDMARAIPVELGRACRDIQRMIDRGDLRDGAYIDMSRHRLVLDQDALLEVPFDVVVEPEPEVTPRNARAHAAPNLHHEKIEEIRALNRAIEDEPVSQKIDKIEALTASIFLSVEDSPEKGAQIQTFMNYYLPTTLKLLRQYSHLERQPLGGQNVAKSRRDIEAVLDKLVQGFEHYLDQLYSADMMDIATDINVLETMMARDGLAENKYVFRRKVD